MHAPRVSRAAKRLAAVSMVVGGLALPFLSRGVPAAAAPLPVGSAGGASLIFSDEFDGTALNTTTWHTCSWWATSTCSIETNNELELYTKNNVSVANGTLKLQARKENAVAWNGKTYNYTSGMVSTGGRQGEKPPGFTFTYGYAEARVKVPAGQGLWPAFWTLPASYDWPPEIDVMEIIGDEPNVTHMHYHYLDGAGTHRGPGASWAGPDFSADWHTFGVDWQPGSLVWYVDGVERHRFTSSFVTAEPQYLLLNLAVGGNWPGSPDSSTPFPSDYLVDYVRVWDRFGTAGSTPTTSPAPPSSSGYAAAVAGDGPVSHWRLGEASGTTAADSVGTNPGSYRNGVALGGASLVSGDTANKAASFDGNDDSVAVQSSSGLSPSSTVTVEAWIQPSAIPSPGNFASVATKAESYALQFNGPQLEFTTMVNGARRRVQAPAGAVTAGGTYHVVGTYDGSAQRLYVNGSQVASASYPGPMGVNTNRVVLGSWDTASEFFAGAIDEVAVYAKALTAAQVANHFSVGSGTATAPPPTTTPTTTTPTTTPPPPASGYGAAVAGDGPVAYWRLGETSGTSAADSAGAHTGTYRNGVAVGAASLTSDAGDRAARFDGVNDSVVVNNTPALSPTVVTVEAWVRPSAIPTSGKFASVVAKAESYALQFNGPRLEFTTMRDGARRRVQAPAGAVVAGRTYHVVGTFDGTTQRLYINGVQVGASTFSAMRTSSARVVIGSWDSSSEFLSGTIDDVAVYDKVLSPAQITNHYNQGRAA
ncbi:MAG: LamG-like jellyroll fold domain-containing protein [Acidimicrobiales bacterium]